MLGQMASFKCGENYYSTKYSPSYIKPKLWWQMVDDPVDYLKSLALKLFSIIPHSTSCYMKKEGNVLAIQQLK